MIALPEKCRRATREPPLLRQSKDFAKGLLGHDAA
jgi:hypothetical protein